MRLLENNCILTNIAMRMKTIQQTLFTQIAANVANRYDILFQPSSTAVKFAQLVRATHGNIISYGTHLEHKVVESIALSNYGKNVNWFDTRHALHAGKVQRLVVSFPNKPRREIDIVTFDENNIQVFELKLGDNFDTKKAESEVHSILEVARTMHATDPLFRRVIPRIVLWHSETPFHNFGCSYARKNDLLLSGPQFCDRFGIAFDDVENTLKLENTKFVERTILELAAELKHKNPNEYIQNDRCTQSENLESVQRRSVGCVQQGR